MASYQCPKCKSNLVFVRWPFLECHNPQCGFSERMVDYPCSTSFQVQYAYHYGGVTDGTPIPVEVLKSTPALPLEEIKKSQNRMQGQLIALRDTLKDLQKGRKVKDKI